MHSLAMALSRLLHVPLVAASRSLNAAPMLRLPPQSGNALVVSMVGCIAACESANPTFDPTGNELALYGEWDVNGLVPSQEVCARAKIDVVSVEFSSVDGTETFGSSDFVAPCAQGFLEHVGPVLRRGTYSYRWIASFQGRTVLESQRYDALESTGPNGPEVALMAVDFLRRVDVQVEATLAFETGSGFGTCQQAQAESLNWELRSGNSLGSLIASSAGSIPCTESFVVNDAPVGVLATGDYVLSVQASASDGATWVADCPVHVHESGSSMTSCEVRSAP